MTRIMERDIMKFFEKVMAVGAILLIVIGSAMAITTYRGYKKGQDGYAKLQTEFTSNLKDCPKTADKSPEEQAGGIPENASVSKMDLGETLPEDAPDRIEVDWEKLKQVNEDIVAWITLPALDLSYPVVQGKDNEYYLHRSVDGEYLFAGSIFMDYFNHPGLENYNTIIYGHNMRDGSMFARLKEYNDTDVYKACPYFWIYTPDGDHLYKIFSVHTASAKSDTYTVRFKNKETYAAWLVKEKTQSQIETGIELMMEDHVVTLSTCTGDEVNRQVVQGVQVYQSEGMCHK